MSIMENRLWPPAQKLAMSGNQLGKAKKNF